MKESLILGGIIVVIALIREPLGYGTLSIPFVGKTLHFLPDAIRERTVLQVFSAPLGGFLLTAFLIAIIRLVSPLQVTKTEDNDD
jgi:Na+-transporting NADH:ubiquinone oxidoreductase subunit NqrD